MLKKIIPLIFLGLLLISACTPEKQSAKKTPWTEIELKDLNSGQNYKVSDFKGKPVLFETFAVWCVNCKSQQQEIKKLHDELKDDVIVISLNADPNEDEASIKKYLQENHFDWHYSIAPKEMTEQLLEEFGFIILNAGSAPIVLVCKDGSYSLLPEGVKDKDILMNSIKSC